MVRGLSKFQEYFSNCTGSYILIGGCACEFNLKLQELKFRATRDFDIVLCAEALDKSFFQVFWQFIRDGHYRICERSTGQKTFYRFHKPESEDFPSMLELFSRRLDLLELPEGAHLTPIPAEEEISSLSAILLDDDYYQFLRDNSSVQGGLSLASPAALIVLKAKAWMDLNLRRQNGESVDSHNIRKHKGDIARLVQLLQEEPLVLPPNIRSDMENFLHRFEQETIDARNLGLIIPEDQVKQVLRKIFAPE